MPTKSDYVSTVTTLTHVYTRYEPAARGAFATLVEAKRLVIAQSRVDYSDEFAEELLDLE